MKYTRINQGDTLRRRVTFSYIGNGEPVILTGCSAYCQMRNIYDRSRYLDGTVDIDEINGLVTVTFSKAKTSSLQPGEYKFDIRLESEGDRRTIYTERVTVATPATER